MLIKSKNDGPLTCIGKETLEGAFIGAVTAVPMAAYAQHSAIKLGKDEFIKNADGVKGMLINGFCGGGYLDKLDDVATTKKYNFKSIAKTGGKNALEWGIVFGLFEGAKQLYYKLFKN